MLTILVADDERSMQEFLEIMLTREGYDVVVASTAEEAIDMISSRSIDLVISDINMPKASGMAVLKSSMETDSNIPVIMITAYAAADTAVEAMKIGAYDYITKPFNIDEIKIVVAKALERRKDKEELGRLKVEVAKSYGVDGDILGKSEQIANIFRMINKMARSRSTVLITGESGTGKELVAKAIHYLSDRKNKPFLSINCGAIPEQLLESELFGHQKGSFTGAVSDKKGLLEIADGGAFFLDEIGGAPLSVQVKLLRVLQEREFKRVGGVKDIKVDVRIIAATNQCLEDLIKDGEFREDLFYRLNILPIHIPPLRERKEDIPLLVSRFIDKYSNEVKRKNISISNEAMSLLESYHWKGNVRELENIIERAVVLTTGSLIEPENFPDEVRSYSERAGQDPVDLPDEGVDLEEVVSRVEKDLLIKALSKTGGKKKEAARLVNLSFRSFRYKLAKYGIGAAGKRNSDE
ncbi:Response regulator of zinc sigma-54-dependent two-component system [hydrothermal vent metagenome]|uniref:Response regulator of zinc sigma-54-dependent two-component system n=1 Tax=hydrothermal vent metagenome TaxID=652676 RepID=A0A3B1C459_9ZZZZ